MIRVLVVEDEPIAADAHVVYVNRVPGFTVTGRAGTAAEALQVLARGEVDLVLLDMVLPDQHGLQVVRAMRAAGHTADVIAVTSARDLAVVRAAVSQGIVQYLIKPFVFSSLRDKLESYRDYRKLLTRDEPVAAQHQVDHLLATLRGSDRTALPKGLSRETFDAVAEALRANSDGRSATEVADLLSTSRITARRYLEHLADTGLASRHPRYRGSGRPEIEYRWRGEG
jgi:response regulator of citrate/malate metabolism